MYQKFQTHMFRADFYIKRQKHSDLEVIKLKLDENQCHLRDKTSCEDTSSNIHSFIANYNPVFGDEKGYVIAQFEMIYDCDAVRNPESCKSMFKSYDRESYIIKFSLSVCLSVCEYVSMLVCWSGIGSQTMRTTVMKLVQV